MPKRERVRGQPQSAWSAPPEREPFEDYQSFGRSALNIWNYSIFTVTDSNAILPTVRSPLGYQSA